MPILPDVVERLIGLVVGKIMMVDRDDEDLCMVRFVFGEVLIYQYPLEGTELSGHAGMTAMMKGHDQIDVCILYTAEI